MKTFVLLAIAALTLSACMSGPTCRQQSQVNANGAIELTPVVCTQ
jgi:uncharacterized lipoprotein